MSEAHLLQELLLLFGLGTAAVVLFHRLNLPPVLGFLVTGVVCGPHGFKLVNDPVAIDALAEIGLVLLLFTIGIEFSVKTFVRIRQFLLIAGGLQVILTTGAAALLAHYVGLTWSSSVFIGMLASLSSTAIVIRILEYRGDLDSAHGRSALSILIFQDLCIVPMVLITPFLGGKGGSLIDVGLIVGKAVLFLVLAGTVARFVMPWILNQVAKTKKREAFVLAVILLCLGTASATSEFGLSMALGAFIAGLIISDSKYSHQALGEVVPFREVFNCLVFVSIGMLFDVHVLLENPTAVIIALAALIGIKALVGAGVTRAMGHSLGVAILTGCALAQISEFSFVIARGGMSVGLLDAKTNQLFLAMAILSMFMTPSVLGSGKRLGMWLASVLPERLTSGRANDLDVHGEEFSDHVIIAGFSHEGRQLAQVLSQMNIKFVVIEHDPVIVKTEREKGMAILYGDAARAEVLEHAGVKTARILVLTMSDADSVAQSTELANRINAELHVIVRTSGLDNLRALVAAGADEVVSVPFVTSVELLARVLRNYKLTPEEIERGLDQLRDSHKKSWKSVLHLHKPREGLAREVLLEVLGGITAPNETNALRVRAKPGVVIVAFQESGLPELPAGKWDSELRIGESTLLIAHCADREHALKLLDGTNVAASQNEPNVK